MCSFFEKFTKPIEEAANLPTRGVFHLRTSNDPISTNRLLVKRLKEGNSKSYEKKQKKGLTFSKDELLFSQAWPQHTFILMRLFKLSDS